MRVVSLLPSATEIVCALGVREMLVGVSHECDFPAEVVGLPVVTSSRIDVHGSSRAIDTAVRAVLVGDALSIYAVDEARLGALRPDVIVTQDLCEVCAVSLGDVRRAVAKLAHARDVTIVSLRPTRLAEVLDDVERVAAALGLVAKGREVRAALAGRIAVLAARARRASRRPRIATLEWIDPLMLGGTWMPELIELAGGVAVGATAGAPAPTIDLAALAALAPDVVVVKPCGFSLARALGETEPLAAIAAAVPAARLYVTDGNAYFNRPGPRLCESLEILAACAHPDLFDAPAGTVVALRPG